jgi:probable biosynthetic protein (TIGR04099 family)
MEQTTQRYRAGMPQLSYTGLSENWLLKECGHRHWEALAAHAGRDVPDFVGDDGAPSYAAFTAIRLRAATFDAIAENDAFDIGTTLCRTGSARHFSRHWLRRDDALHCVVSMSSTFVRREEVRNNRSVSRATLATLSGATATAPDEATAMARLGKRLRAGELDESTGLSPADRVDADPLHFLPCPNNDFNGADFLYFASFQAFVDRAEWQRHCFAEPPLVTRRDLFYYGNVNVGEPIVVRVAAERLDDRGIVHWCELRRGSDLQKIADVVTAKRWRRR